MAGPDFSDFRSQISEPQPCPGTDFRYRFQISEPMKGAGLGPPWALVCKISQFHISETREHNSEPIGQDPLIVTQEISVGGSTAGVLAIVHFGSVGRLCGLFERSKAT